MALSLIYKAFRAVAKVVIYVLTKPLNILRGSCILKDLGTFRVSVYCVGDLENISN